jgi:hypothetical protein
LVSVESNHMKLDALLAPVEQPVKLDDLDRAKEF